MTEPTRVFELLEYQVAHFPKADALCAKVNGEWQKLSSEQFWDQAKDTARGLAAIGIQPGDRVAIVSTNRPEWVIMDYAIQMAGAISVPLYPTITAEDYRFIFTDSGAKLVLCGTEELLHKAQEACSKMQDAPTLFTFDVVAGTPHWKEITASAQATPMEEIERRKAAVKEEDLFTIIYTSGTTGTPKGVMLTHRNLSANIAASIVCFPAEGDTRALSFLPLCHVYERMVMGIYVRLGVSVYFAESMETIGENLKEVKPQLFTTVPRLLEKVYDRIVATGRGLTGIKRVLFFWALELGHRYEVGKPMGFWYDIQLKLANKLIFNKWRAALGGNVAAIVSGSAALQPRLCRVFRAAQIPVMEGYGLTETSPVVSVNRVTEDGCRVGTVGPLINNVEVTIAEDGEILVKGPNVFIGYWNRPDLTAEAFTADGWYKTGDIGRFEEERFLKITDRKKEIFKTSGGKYIAPQPLENTLKESLVVDQVMIIGDGQKFPSALIVPNYVNLREWCKIKEIPYSTDEEMIGNLFVQAKYQSELDKMNEGLAQYEKIKKFALIPHAWTIERGEITPTLKLRRKVILEHAAPYIKHIYAD
jgi:long-chain acyl-CoA synthetase